MAEWVKCELRKHEGLSLEPSIHERSQAVLLAPVIGSRVEEQTQEDPDRGLPINLAEKQQLRVQ